MTCYQRGTIKLRSNFPLMKPVWKRSSTTVNGHRQGTRTCKQINFFILSLIFEEKSQTMLKFRVPTEGQKTALT